MALWPVSDRAAQFCLAVAGLLLSRRAMPDRLGQETGLSGSDMTGLSGSDMNSLSVRADQPTWYSTRASRART